MNWIVKSIWLIPLLPLAAAALLALAPRTARRLAVVSAVGAMGIALLFSCLAFFHLLELPAELRRVVVPFNWLQIGDSMLTLGWVLDPLAAVMLVMVTFVGLLIFIYSAGYMAEDGNFTRFFCFLSLFAAAMLGLILANSLLLLFICWELVGLASYLLIGFWFQKPEAAAAARKAFITTRIGDVGFFLGMLWLYSETGTLLFYDDGAGCMEGAALARLAAQTTMAGMAVSTCIALLIFCGAIGKSGQVPLHVWLPDAMEGPTPVSALIHAATMVAAGVYLVARVFPLMSLQSGEPGMTSDALQVVAWVGAVTAVFAALIAVTQADIKRILAYSTVSQLGFMMVGLAAGGVAVGMFHLITHGFFKALLFLGAGSVIHGCHGEQDIRNMGGLRRFMPVTFATYAIGMMALAGVPIFFAGFWSKDEILHAAHAWGPSQGPFYLVVFGALLTAFYMTRQICLVFFGPRRERAPAVSPVAHLAQAPEGRTESAAGHTGPRAKRRGERIPAPHESPRVMTIPLMILAAGTILLGFLGTPAWPWFQSFLSGTPLHGEAGHLFEWEVVSIMLLSAVVALAGIGLGWMVYGRRPAAGAAGPDPLEPLKPDVYWLLKSRFLIDELYGATVIRGANALARGAAWLDRFVWGGAVILVSVLALGCSWLSRLADEHLINWGFDRSCDGLKRGAGLTSRLQDGKVQNYLKGIGVAMALLVLLLTWGCSA